MVPLQRVALDEQHRKECEDNQRDNLLDDLQLPQRKRSTKLGATYAVGGNLEAVLKQCYTPAEQHDSNHTVALQARLEGDVAVPRKGHKDIRADQQSDGR